MVTCLGTRTESGRTGTRGDSARDRSAIEGKVYPTLADREADPARVQRLAGWDWIADAFRQLSVAPAAIAA